MHGRTAESDGRRESPRKILHAQARPISGLYPPLHALAPPAASRNRYAGIFPRQSTFGSPDGADPGTRRLHPQTAKNTPQHRAAAGDADTHDLATAYEPTEHERAALKAYFARDETCPPAPRMKVVQTDGAKAFKIDLRIRWSARSC